MTRFILEAIETTADKIQSCAYLWDGSQLGWVLLADPELDSGYCLYNRIDPTLLHIDDERLNRALCQKMREAGCEVLDAIGAQLTVKAQEPN